MTIQRHEAGVRVMIARIVILTFLFVTLFTACAKHIELTREAPQKTSRSGDLIALSSKPPELVVQLSHTHDISAMALSANGRFLITASSDKTVRIWDAAGGLEIRRFEGHAKVVNAVSLSRDGGIALTGSKDGKARLWRTSDGEQIFSLTGHSEEVTAVAFSPDETSILTGGSDRTIRLWRRKDGKEIWKSAGFASKVSSVAFTPDGDYALFGSHLVVQLWDIKRNKEVRRFEGHTGGVTSVAVSPCGRFVLTGSLDNTARLWNIDTGKEIQRFMGHTNSINTVAFSSDGSQVLSASEDGTARLWDVSSAKEIRQFCPHPGFSVYSAAISPDGQHVFTASKETAHAWDVKGGKLIRSFKGNSELMSTVAFSPDGRYALIGSWDDTARLWDLTSGLQIRRLVGHTGDVRGVAFSPDGRFVLTGSRDGTARLWETASGTLLHSFTGHSTGVRPVSFSPDGSRVLTGGDDGIVRVWGAEKPFLLIKSLCPCPEGVTSAVFSPKDGHLILIASGKNINLWDESSGEETPIKGHEEPVNSVAFSADGNLALSASDDKTARLWDLKTREDVRKLAHSERVYTAIFSPDNRFILTGSGDGIARLWNASNGEEVRRFQGHTSRVVGVAFSPDGRFIVTTSEDQTARLWNVTTGKEKCRIVLFNDGAWAVVDLEGRFDASNGGDVDGLHWVVGTETIALSQLKERYYEPGLLAKIMGLNKEPLSDVKAFKSVALYPAIELTKPAAGDPTLGIKLTNRGGGIGRVVVWINGKGIAPDSRGEKVAPDAESAELSIDIKGHPYLIPGEKNRIEVRAYNAEGYLSSRGVIVDYDAPRMAPSEFPTLWAIISGISDYKGTDIDLGYAAKDAVDVANAVRLGASRLFGADRVQMSLLTTEPTSEAAEPSKKNLVEAFTKARKAKSTDILLVYLAGHGVTYGGAGGDYYYLTRDAMMTDLSAAGREAVSLSSNELSELIGAIPATKQALVLDTCGAGMAVQALSTLSTKREVSTKQKKIFERMKDQFGLFILGGATADKVSYEASRFGQGLLTYSLLLGMKQGPGLRKERFIDIDTLFNYAVESVPTMAKDIGGIQQPIKAIPKGGTSFDLGELTTEDRAQIKVASPKPFVLRSDFQDAEQFIDHLTLEQRVNRQWKAISRRGREAAVIFVDADDAPDAYYLIGRYQCRNEDVTADVRVFRGGKEVGRYIEHGKKAEADTLAQKIVERAQETIRQQPR